MSESDSPGLNPMQSSVLDVLAKPVGWEPLPEEVLERVRSGFVEGLKALEPLLREDDPVYVSKHKISSVLSCEKQFINSQGSFQWTTANSKGQVAHKAIELLINWRGSFTPMDLAEAAIDRLSDASAGPGSIGEFLAAMSPAEFAELKAEVVDFVTKFIECFPPIKREWQPVVESATSFNYLGRALVLSGKTDLMLGQPGAKVIIDFKTGNISPVHRDDLRFYSLIELLRSNRPPRLVASYSLSAARPDPEPVNESTLRVASMRALDGITRILELTRRERKADVTPGVQCRWCHLAQDCEVGQAWLNRSDEDFDE
jgi:hypothetical protein